MCLRWIARAALVVLLLSGGWSGLASAHEVRPGFLELKETGPARFAVTWKQPILGERILRLKPVFPAGCAASAGKAEQVGAALIRRFELACRLDAGEIRIEGLEQSLTDVFLRIERLDGSVAAHVLRPASPAADLAAPAGAPLAGYVRIGVEHILFGWDHLLFVAGLVLLVRPRQLLAAVSAFTLAHSITLTLATLGHASLPSAPVEITIALSITLVALEALRRSGGEEGLSARLPWLVAFGFGLIHGFGFAGALSEIGLPDGARAWALFLFNVGVEIGQLALIGVLLLAGCLIKSWKPASLAPVMRAGAYIVGIAGAYWTIERTAALLQLA
jgi:hypothetical protein